MPHAITLTIAAAPRTKGNSYTPGVTKSGRPFMRPSPEHEAWLDNVMTYAPAIRAQLAGKIPIEGPVYVTALFYRDRDQGDAVGYYQALADALQEPQFKCEGCGCKLRPQQVTGHRCGRVKQVRRGLGIIVDDRQIEHWDGSRRLIDRKNPRIELEVVPIVDAQVGMFEELAEVAI